MHSARCGDIDGAHAQQIKQADFEKKDKQRHGLNNHSHERHQETVTIARVMTSSTKCDSNFGWIG